MTFHKAIKIHKEIEENLNNMASRFKIFKTLDAFEVIVIPQGHFECAVKIIICTEDLDKSYNLKQIKIWVKSYILETYGDDPEIIVKYEPYKII